MMVCRGLYVFTHRSPFGDEHAHTLFNRLEVELDGGVEIPRSFRDYRIRLRWDDAAQAQAMKCANGEDQPKVCLTRLVEAAASDK